MLANDSAQVPNQIARDFPSKECLLFGIKYIFRYYTLHQTILGLKTFSYVMSARIGRTI